MAMSMQQCARLQRRKETVKINFYSEEEEKQIAEKELEVAKRKQTGKYQCTYRSCTGRL